MAQHAPHKRGDFGAGTTPANEARAAPEKVAVSLREFATARSIGLTSAWGFVASGRLKVGRIGRRVVVYLEDARAFDEAARSPRGVAV